MFDFEGYRHRFETNDGVGLSYIDSGQGPAIVLVHGWSQCAEAFGFQITHLSQSHRVVALDQRGHGFSDKPAHGYRIARLAKDLHELLEHLDLHGMSLLGHSMGCSVVWSYLDQFGPRRLRGLILVDEPPCPLANPAWSDDEIQEAGAIFTPDSVFELANALAGPDGVQATWTMMRAMFTAQCPDDLFDWVIECSLLMPRKEAASLLLSNVFNDWRDLIPRLDLPTLIIGARAGATSMRAIQWMTNQIKGARLEVFDESDGGAHDMFLENPDRFNRILLRFLSETAT